MLSALLAAAVLEPLYTYWTERTRVLATIMVVVVNLGVLFAIFEQRWERWLACFLVAVVLAAGIVHQTEPRWTDPAAIAYYGFGAVFFGFAVATILRGIFQQKAIHIDAVIGALCGYLLAGFTWANAYALVYLLRPNSFRLTNTIAEHLGNWYSRHFFFNYFSVTTLASLGYNDMTPVGPIVLLLSWIEVVFGQFYIAVVVAQLVGLKLAESIRQGNRDSN